MSIYGDRLKQFKPTSGSTAQEILIYRLLQAMDTVASAAPLGGSTATEAKQDDIIAALAGIDSINANISLDASVDELESINTDIKTAVELLRDRTTPKSKLYRLQNEAEDTVETYTFLDAGLSDERISTIVYSSVALSISATETYVFSGSSPDFFLSTITVT